MIITKKKKKEFIEIQYDVIFLGQCLASWPLLTWAVFKIYIHTKNGAKQKSDPRWQIFISQETVSSLPISFSRRTERISAFPLVTITQNAIRLMSERRGQENGFASWRNIIQRIQITSGSHRSLGSTITQLR